MYCRIRSAGNITHTAGTLNYRSRIEENMNTSEYIYYTKVLKEQLIPATGCTEPIALAYAAAVGRKTLGMLPQKVTAAVSGSIVKNVKSVVVPATSGMKGIESAIAAGITVGKEDSALEVLSCAPPDTARKISMFLKQCPIEIALSSSERVFDIQITMEAQGHTALVRIVDTHTNIVLIQRNGEILLEKEIPDQDGSEEEGAILKISKIVEYARTCSMEDVSETIEHQISCNTALSEEGMKGGWGAEIGRLLLLGKEAPDVKLRAMAAAAAGSDARMSGCELPAVINSGSGNQGLTVTMPIVEYAKELNVGHEQLIRALVLANLIAVRIKQSIGYLSAYCGAICAGCSAAAGVAFLYGGNESIIEHTVVNGLAILSGTICDGAKPSCAAKIAMAVNAGLLGFQMAAKGKEFVHGEGIIKKGIENTIEEVGVLSRDGMNITNKVILDIMVKG